MSFDFVHPLSEVQKSHPRFTARLQLVQDLLSKTIGPGAVNTLLDRDTPGQVHFANRVSCEYYGDFVRQQCDDHELIILLASCALVEWDKISAGQPKIVNGLGVVKNHKGKLRLILDCR